MCAAGLFVLAALLGAAASDGASLVAHGNSHGILPCAACHGADLKGNAATGAGRLIGNPASQTRASLRRIAGDASRGNYAMHDIARSMTPAERRAIAAYLATLR
ncbi:cytochrome c [Acidiphilium sp. AL]|uniref:c-type cytochrome n=1 Tax=Acidiphilium sp. AL TaxID=2871704 RepID=UPI0021CB0E57|nr:cytochrome c [Acidiphilium sp. AL]MCU4161378.1 cytochrome c [Acidiphilium sp. AL]